MRSHALPAAVDAGTGVLPATLLVLLVLLVTTTLAAAVWAARTTSPVTAAVTGAVGALASLAHPVGIGFLALAVALLVLAPHWTPTAWQATFGTHPIFRNLAGRLVWQIARPEGVTFARPDGEAGIVHNGDVAIALGDVLNFKHGITPD